MIITAMNKEEAKKAMKWLKAIGFSYKTSIYWSQEWRKGNEVVFLHRGYLANGKPSGDWRKYAS